MRQLEIKTDNSLGQASKDPFRDAMVMAWRCGDAVLTWSIAKIQKINIY
jgi:hypothetical protein